LGAAGRLLLPLGRVGTTLGCPIKQFPEELYAAFVVRCTGGVLVKIRRIVVSNFCSIEKADFCPSDFSILVGQNNHGKTNFFEAVSWFYSGKGNLDDLRFGRRGNAEVSVEIEFAGVQDALLKMRNEKNRASIEKLLGGADTVRAIRSSADPKIRKIFDERSGVWTEKNPAGFDTAFNDFLPIFEYVDTSTHLADVSKFAKTTPLGSMLSAVLMALLEKSEPYREFREKFDKLFTGADSDVRIELDKISSQVTIYIAKQFPDCTEVTFKIAEPAFEDLLKGCTTQVDDGIATDAGEKGDGMQRALMLAILQTYADFRKRDEATGKNFIFFIDEAELHLHPTAQRKLKEALREISSKGDQVFINTHSSVLVADDFPEQSIFRVEKCEHKTYIQQVSSRAKPEIFYELLGGSPADLLLPRNFLIVEGRSDMLFLSAVIARFYPTMPPIQIIYSEGDIERQRKSMDAINALYLPLFTSPVYANRLVILCDAPSTEKSRKDFEVFKAAYQGLTLNNQLFVFDKPSIEECYPEPFTQSPEQVVELEKHRGFKAQLAEHVAQQITQEQFEADMAIAKRALDRSWELAFT
jgi:putative ATP-dependent endonuclease of OLD family